MKRTLTSSQPNNTTQKDEELSKKRLLKSPLCLSARDTKFKKKLKSSKNNKSH